MIGQKAVSEKEIVITAADFDRLHGLVESPRYRTTHAVLLHTLKEELDRGKVVQPDRVPGNVVTMRSKVRIQDLKDNEREPTLWSIPRKQTSPRASCRSWRLWEQPCSERARGRSSNLTPPPASEA